MTSADKKTGAISTLRQRALAMARNDRSAMEGTAEALSSEASSEILHELRVHQIELEMQNEELRQAQVELDASRTRYFELYDMAPVGYYTVHQSTGRILQANLAASSLLGMDRGELINQPITRFIDKDDQDIYYRHHRELLASEQTQWCDLRMQKADGTPFWAQLAASTATESNGVPVLRIMLNDISERKRDEIERLLLDQVLQVKSIELENARIVAEKANLAKSEFLSSMSHELRTPLSAILGFAQLMESSTPELTPTQKRNNEQILKAGWYLLDLINEILDLTLIESGKLSLSVAAVSLSEILLECESMVKVQSQQRGIGVKFPQLEQPCFIKADRIRVKQVLVNLLSNAIKYNKALGAVNVECTFTTPEVLRISVHDTGPGLTPEKMVQLFQPFNRLGQEATSEQGTGIGLVVCKRLIDLMNGRIGVESTVGNGSVFWVELPLTSDALLATEDCEPIKDVHPAPDNALLRTLLYVEDNPANLMLVEEIIKRRTDIRLLSARDGISGIKLIHEHQPDVILMDIKLPGISGLEVLKILLNDPATAHIPVIALSANAMAHDIEKGLAAGFFGYLTKPIKINAFMAALDVALKAAKPKPIEQTRA